MVLFPRDARAAGERGVKLQDRSARVASHPAARANGQTAARDRVTSRVAPVDSSPAPDEKRGDLQAGKDEEAARLAGLSRSAAYEWHNRYEEEGIEGLRDRPRPGRQPRPKLGPSL